MDFVFFGTPEFSRRILKILTKNHHRILLAVTQPDRQAGRGRKTVSPPVKSFCRSLGIPCLQPENLKNPGLPEMLRKTGSEVGLVASYGGYLPGSLLRSLPHGFINLHPSLLPKYRGAAPVNWAIIRGERKTGMTVIKVTEKMDAGPILLQQEIAIKPEETAGELLMRMAKPGANLFLAALDKMMEGPLHKINQDETMVTYAPRLRKEDGLIQWNYKLQDIINLIRGVNPWPGAYTFHGKTMIKILKAKASDLKGRRPGEILSADPKKGLMIAAGDGSLTLEVLQKEGGKPLYFDAFLRGARWKEGEFLSLAPSDDAR